MYLAWVVVTAHALNPSTWETEAGGSLSLRPAWSTRAGSRTGSNATEETCLEKQKTKNKKTKKKPTTTKEKPYLDIVLEIEMDRGRWLEIIGA